MNSEEFEIKKKMIHDLLRSDFYVPMKLKEMAIFLSVPKEQKQELRQIMESLIQDGKAEVTAKGKYVKASGKFLQGKFIGHAKGFGFVEIEEREDDIFIPANQVNGAMNGDIVSVKLSQQQSGNRIEGSVVKVIERNTKTIVGTYEKTKTFGFVVPDDVKITKDIFIPQERSKGALSGHKVVVEITKFADGDKNPEGKILEILGHITDPGTDILAIIKSHNIEIEFPEKVINQAERVAKEVTGADMAGRFDIREWQTVTIDGEDAKDLDDAITLTKNQKGYTLGVHIADVTNYVQENSALDHEASERATSVYLVDRVIPMLPRVLSNGMCSLNQGEDRLALSCIMEIDKKGNVTGHKISETVINVDRRMTYTAVKQILEDNDSSKMEEYSEFIPMFKDMEELASILRKKRRKRGSIDFDFPETKIKLDDMGKPIYIAPYDRNTATKIIEDFMLLANETVAEDYFWQEIPFVYRTHETPDPERIQKLSTFINNFGYTLRMTQDAVHPKELQKLLDKIEGTDEEPLISRLTLRSMRQAKYDIENAGHFGLATKYYCHFTSPIRRYPDLQIHRIIKENLRGKMNAKRIEHYERILPEIAKHCSERERRADETERETTKLKKAEFMASYLGEEFEGVISSVTGWGIYVELPNTIEGLVHITALNDDYYVFNEETYELVGSATNRRYKLGQKVNVTVTNVDLQMRTIDFELTETLGEQPGMRKKNG
ncbi:MAG: ribonuclease R [Lachnospiraceae bacterium]